MLYNRHQMASDTKSNICWYLFFHILLLNIIFNIFVGSTDNNVHILYNPKMSQRGALLCLAKQPKILKFDEVDARQNIINPHSLPLFKESLGNKRKKYENKKWLCK